MSVHSVVILPGLYGDGQLIFLRIGLVLSIENALHFLPYALLLPISIAQRHFDRP